MSVKRSIRPGRRQEGRQPPGFEGVAVQLLGAFCIEFFKPICFVGGQGGPKEYVTVVSSSSDNFYIIKNFIFFPEKISETNISIFRNL